MVWDLRLTSSSGQRSQSYYSPLSSMCNGWVEVVGLIVAPAGILSDPEKRHKYDQGGFASLTASDLEVQVDLSSLGVVNTAVAAFFNKLGETCYIVLLVFYNHAISSSSHACHLLPVPVFYMNQSLSLAAS